MHLGRAAADWDVKSVDWVPTLHLGHNRFDASSQAVARSVRATRYLNRTKRIAEVCWQLSHLLYWQLSLINKSLEI